MADNLWVLRDQKKISVATLASRAGLPIGLILEYESGQRSIDPRHLNRIARALYIEEADIKLQSDPRPGAAPLERQPSRDAPRDMARPYGDRPPMPRPAAGDVRPRERPMRPRFEPRPPLPARPSQIVHLEGLLKRLDQSLADLEAQVGKPISSLDRVALSALLKDLQAKVKDAPTPVRHRAYLPESVDEFEARYLAAAQAASASPALHSFRWHDRRGADHWLRAVQHHGAAGGWLRGDAEQAGTGVIHKAVRR